MSNATKQHEDQGSGNGGHGSGHEVTIVVNGQPKVVEKGEVSFDELVALAFENPPTGDNWIITITYRRGHGDKPEGSLLPGKSVKVKEGMIFNVDATDKS